MDVGYTGLRIFWSIHRLLDRATGGRFDTRRFFGMRSLFLTTTGRKTGQSRENALYYIKDGNDLVVVASNAGRDRPPAWWLNLLAEPRAEVRLGTNRRTVRARAATPEEEQRLWPRLDAAFPMYAQYRERTTRRIPVEILEPDGGARGEQATTAN